MESMHECTAGSAGHEGKEIGLSTLIVLLCSEMTDVGIVLYGYGPR